MRDAAARVAPDVRRAIGRAARHIARVARRQLPRSCAVDGGAGRLRRTARGAPRLRRVLRAGRPLSAAVVAPDHRDSSTVAASGRSRRLSRRGRRSWRRRSKRESFGCSASGALSPSARSRLEQRRFRAWTNRRPWQPLCRGRTKACMADDCAINFHAGPTEIVVLAGSGRSASTPPTWWRRRSTTPTRGRSSSPGTIAGRSRRPGRRQPGRRPADRRDVADGERRGDCGAQHRGSGRDRESHRPGAPGRGP